MEEYIKDFKKEYDKLIGYVPQEERYNILLRQITNNLNRDLTEKELRYISWISNFDMDTCETFGKLFEDMSCK